MKKRHIYPDQPWLTGEQVLKRMMAEMNELVSRLDLSNLDKPYDQIPTVADEDSEVLKKVDLSPILGKQPSKQPHD
jgi:hypothetical protein